MINSNFRKKMTESWFSYLQIQICKSFEFLENNKLQFTKRDWQKNSLEEGGGTSYLMTGGKIFDKVGVNKSTVSGTFPKKFRSKILGAEKKGTYWASGISVVAHMKNPKIPALHFNTRFIVTSKEWFGGGMDATPSHNDDNEKKAHLTVQQKGAGNGKTYGIWKSIANNKNKETFFILTSQHTAKDVIMKELEDQIERNEYHLSNMREGESTNHNGRQYLWQYTHKKTNKNTNYETKIYNTGSCYHRFILTHILL